MMPALMIYVVLVACLIGGAAYLAERIIAGTGGVRRGIWLVSLVASVALPGYSLLADLGPTARGPDPVLAMQGTAAPSKPEVELTAPGADEALQLTLPDWSRWPIFGRWYATGRSSWTALDRVLAAAWIACCAAALLVYGVAWLGLNRASRRWHGRRLDGTDVLISSGLGPATFGLAKARIVVPRWLLDAPLELRALVLRHEREHVAARDHWLLAVALLIVVIAPWNAALWWQMRRLRTAMEIDCDARVVRGGADAVAYSQALLTVRQRRAVSPLAAIALTDPVSQLERRIRVVLEAPRRLSRAVAVSTALIAAAFIAAACAVAPPETASTTARDIGESASRVHRQPITGMRLGGERVVILVDVSETMLDRTLAGVERRRNQTPQQQRQAPKWRQLVETVQDLTAQLRPGTQFQIIAYDGEARSLIANGDGTWLEAGRPALVEQAVQTLHNETRPQGPSNLRAAFTAAARLQPAAETIYLVTDGLPNVGPADGEASDDEERRMTYFELATAALPPTASVNVILLPMEDGPVSAPAYWALALRTGGSLLAPAGDGGEGAIRGVSLDSEYLVFVIDTSGSMRQFAWDDMRNEMAETMDAYPSVKGIQVLSDGGEFMLRQFGNDWIPNTPAQRNAVLESLADWNAFSDSNPSEGILTAIESLSGQDEDVAVYIYGDDFASAPAANDFLISVSDRNRLDDLGNRRARINSVAFPVYYRVTGDLMSAATYAALMRELSQRNGGSFIGLPVDRDGR